VDCLKKIVRLKRANQALIPIHTDAPEKFAELFSDEWSVILLNDGESVSRRQSADSIFPELARRH
jgi:ribonuclease J